MRKRYKRNRRSTRRSKESNVMAAQVSPRRATSTSPRKSPGPRRVIKLTIEDGGASKHPVKNEIVEEEERSPFMTNFEGRLTEEEAGIGLSTPVDEDRRLFELAKEELPETLASYSTPQRKGRSPEIRCLHLGIKTALVPWHSAPFPAEYYTKDGRLWMCEWCLKYIRNQRTMRRHVRKCAGRPPPGQEIYRKDNLSVFEVNGRTQKYYCQNLCLLAKMFLDHKTLYYDVETFLFYVLIEWKPSNARPVAKRRACLASYSLVGYFSKEKHSPANYNLSCIMTLPNHQRKGYGNFLIDFSYLLSRIEGRTAASPEKPLSDLGLISYTSYWCRKVLGYLVANDSQQGLSLESISRATGISMNDILGVLEHYNAIRWDASSKSYYIVIEEGLLEAFRSRMEEQDQTRSVLFADHFCLRWTPYTSPR